MAGRINFRLPQLLRTIQTRTHFQHRPFILSSVFPSNVQRIALSRPITSCQFSTTINKEKTKYINNIDQTNYQKEIIESPVPVLVYFYGEYHPSTKPLTELLEEKTLENRTFRLAKINAEKTPELAKILGAKIVPSLMSFYHGKKAGEFLGGKVELLEKFIQETSALSDSVQIHVKSLKNRGHQLLQINDVTSAAATFKKLIEDETLNAQAIGLAGLARCALQDKKLELAKGIINEINQNHPIEKDKEEVRLACSLVELAEGIEKEEVGEEVKNKSIEELRKRASETGDAKDKYGLACGLLRMGMLETAIEECLDIVKKDKRWNNEGARKLLLRIFDVVGSSSPTVALSRQKLSALWFT